MSTETLTPMQQELLKRADAIYDTLAKSVATATNFAIDQLPDIAYQYLTYNRVYITVIFLAWLAVFIFGVWLGVWVGIKNIFKLKDTKWGDINEGRQVIWLPAIMAITAGLIGSINHIKPLIIVWLAPKIFLIEQLIHLVRH